MLHRGLLVALVALLCSCTNEALQPWQRPSATSRWAIASAEQPDLDRFVARRARDARAMGLRPIVHIRTYWNTGVFLREHMEDPAVVEALRGFYLIEIDFDQTCLERDCPSVWGSEGLCGSWAQTFHAVGLDGKPATPSASPGKFGPQTAEENAAMLDDYRALLDRAERDVCHPLQFRGR